VTDLRSQLQTTLGAAYTLERELGGGGMSRVFVAEEMALGRRVVVKVLPPDLTAGVNVDRFKREIQVAARLQHSHIVPVLTAGEMDGVPYYTMPFVEGESLRGCIARTGPLAMREAIGVLRDVAKALAYAHEHGVVHRDIKPDNVMLAGGSATVVDFGIAKAISAARTDTPNATLTQVGTSIGTPAYMAPEQAAGDPDTDHRADLYAFGCMAYETLTGRPPFTATSPHKLMAAHMSETPQHIATLRPDTPDSLAALVMRCLEKDPDRRPASASELVATLDTVTSGSGHPSMPAILLSGKGMLTKALVFYALAFVIVAIVAKAAIVAIGLPDWVFPGSLIVMALGLPVILFTAYVHHTTRTLVTRTPTLTPGGTPSMQHGTMATIAMKASPHMSWRRTVMGGASALVGFVLLVGGFMVLRAFGIGPAGSLLAAGSIKAREPLLVTDFKVTNADTTLGRVLSDAAKTQLSQSAVITLLPPEGVAAALRRMQRAETSTLDLALARELGVRNGIKAIVDGEITGLGSGGGYIVTMKLVTTDSAKELASFRQTASTAAGLIEAVDLLARQLRGKVGESLKSVRAAPRLEQATTASLEALRKYTEGVRAENLQSNAPQAIALLREAVAIDTAFAEAWRKLGMVLSNAGRPRAEIDSALAQAYRYRDRVPESSRDMIVAAYYRTGPGHDRAKAVAAYESMLRRGDSMAAAHNLALTLTSRREFARAESLYAASERIEPGNFRPRLQLLANIQRRLGKFAAADSTAAVAVVRFPDLRENMHRDSIIALQRRGDTAAFRRIIDSMFTRGDSAAKAWSRGSAHLLALLDGRLTRALEILVQNRPPSTAATPRQRLNWALNPYDAWTTATWKRQPDVLAKRLDEALAGYHGTLAPNEYFDIATRYSWAKRPDKARQYLARFDAEVKDTALKRDMAPQIAGTLGDVLLAEGKGLEAAAQYRLADRGPDGPASPCIVCLSSGLAEAYDRAGVADSAIKYYEHYITTYDFDRYIYDPVALAGFSHRLGELYEQKGDHEKATRYYLNFVNLWKNADPDLQPQVAEVRRRLARLADTERPKP
jgi:tetratricopeptide (TPR) repeat protein